MALSQQGTKSTTIIISKQQKVETPIEKEAWGINKTHVSKSSESDKEVPLKAEINQPEIIIVAPEFGERWRKNKKREAKWFLPHLAPTNLYRFFYNFLLFLCINRKDNMIEYFRASTKCNLFLIFQIK